jgi:hypothetical protein
MNRFNSIYEGEKVNFIWHKPVIVLFKEGERKAFVVVKAKQLEISENEGDHRYKGYIKDFFSLMGDSDYISSADGLRDRYVLCWFDDLEDDFSKAAQRLFGVVFPNGVSYITNERGKRTYNTHFMAQNGKLRNRD